MVGWGLYDVSALGLNCPLVGMLYSGRFGTEGCEINGLGLPPRSAKAPSLEGPLISFSAAASPLWWNELFTSRHWPWKEVPGCRTVKQLQARMIMTPSRIMKRVSSCLKSLPSKPPESSIHRYTLRMKMVTVATTRPMRKALKRRELVSEA